GGARHSARRSGLNLDSIYRSSDLRLLCGCGDSSIDSRRKLVEGGLPDQLNKAVAASEYVPVRQPSRDGAAGLVRDPCCTEPQQPGCFGGKFGISFSEARGAQLALAVDAEDDENRRWFSHLADPFLVSGPPGRTAGKPGIRCGCSACDHRSAG